MYDSTNPYDIPQGVAMVAGYIDGAYAWPGAGWKFHDASAHVRIATRYSTANADVLDVENGDATPGQAALWLASHVQRNEWRVLYFSRSAFGAVHAAVLNQGVADDQWGIWVAEWNNRADVPAGALAHQYANPTLTGRHYDLSAVADYWPGVDALPPPPPSGGRSRAVANWGAIQGLFNLQLPGFIGQLSALQSEIERLG